MALPANRQQLLWGFHLIAYFTYLGLYGSGLLAIDPQVGKAIAVIWFAVWVQHAFVAFGFYSVDDEKPKRESVQDNKFSEKPKRHVRLSDDGELIEVDDVQEDSQPGYTSKSDKM